MSEDERLCEACNKFRKKRDFVSITCDVPWVDNSRDSITMEAEVCKWCANSWRGAVRGKGRVA